MIMQTKVQITLPLQETKRKQNNGNKSTGSRI